MLWPMWIIESFFGLLIQLELLYFAIFNHFGDTGNKPVGNLGLARRDLGSTPEDAVYHIRLCHFRVPPQVRPGAGGTFERPPVSKRSGDTGGERAPLSACCLLGAARADADFFLYRERNGRAS